MEICEKERWKRGAYGDVRGGDGRGVHMEM